MDSIYDDTATAAPIDPPKTEASPNEIQDEKDPEKRECAGTEVPREYPKSTRLVLITVAFMIAVFLVAIEGSILATAIPRITTEFQSLDDVAWYGSGYQMMNMALQPTYGRLYVSFTLKAVFAVAVFIFCIGTVVCATAPSSAVLIFGRVTQGSGSAGIIGGALSMGVFVVPKQRFPLYVAIVSSVYAAAAAVGPVLGGIFADSTLTWRFCFWVNLPIAAVALGIIVIVFPEPIRTTTQTSLRRKLSTLDPLGGCLLIAAITCLLLALQWGGVSLPWSDSRVVGCLVGFSLLLIAFLIFQALLEEKASISIRIITQRSIAAGCVFAGCLIIAASALGYYLPFFFQGAKGYSAETSGLYILPWAITNTFMTFVSGTAITLTGIYMPWMVVSAGIMVTGCTLIATFDVASTPAQMIGYQLLTSIGFGLGVQVPLTAFRAVLSDEEDMPTANALFILFQGFGSAVGTSIAQTIFTNGLIDRITPVLGGDIGEVSEINTTDVAEDVPPPLIPAIRIAYSEALQDTFMLAVGAAGLAFVASLAMEWKKLHESLPEVSPKTSAEGPSKGAQDVQ